MIEVTVRAAQLLREIQEGHVHSSSKILRLVNRDDDFKLAYDERREGDQIIQSGEADVLLIGKEVAELLEEAIIDCHETPDGPRFTLSR